jgi:hypothetical protein
MLLHLSVTNAHLFQKLKAISRDIMIYINAIPINVTTVTKYSNIIHIIRIYMRMYVLNAYNV